MAEDQKGVKLKPKPSLVRLNGSASPVVVGMPGQKMAKLCSFKAPRDLTLGAANAASEHGKRGPLQVLMGPCGIRLNSIESDGII